MQAPKLHTQLSFEAIPDSRKMKDEYTLGQTLGSGAFSVVKKAVRKSDGLVVAIKCITRAKLSHSEVKNLEREVRIMREFHHPHGQLINISLPNTNTLIAIVHSCIVTSDWFD